MQVQVWSHQKLQLRLMEFARDRHGENPTRVLSQQPIQLLFQSHQPVDDQVFWKIKFQDDISTHGNLSQEKLVEAWCDH